MLEIFQNVATKFSLKKGFFKSTDHRPLTHRPTDHRPNRQDPISKT